MTMKSERTREGAVYLHEQLQQQQTQENERCVLKNQTHLKVCRCCLDDDVHSKYFPLDQVIGSNLNANDDDSNNNEIKVTYLDCLNVCAQIDASNDDKLPFFICVDCSQVLEACCEFIRCVRNADKILKKKYFDSLKRIDRGFEKKRRDPVIQEKKSTTAQTVTNKCGRRFPSKSNQAITPLSLSSRPSKYYRVDFNNIKIVQTPVTTNKCLKTLDGSESSTISESDSNIPKDMACKRISDDDLLGEYSDQNARQFQGRTNLISKNGHTESQEDCETMQEIKVLKEGSSKYSTHLCQFCGKCFQRRFHLLKHEYRVHKSDTVPETLKNKFHKNYSQDHAKFKLIRQGAKRFPNIMDGNWVFITEKEIRAKRFLCEICSAAYSFDFELKSHMRTHENDFKNSFHNANENSLLGECENSNNYKMLSPNDNKSETTGSGQTSSTTSNEIGYSPSDNIFDISFNEQLYLNDFDLDLLDHSNIFFNF